MFSILPGDVLLPPPGLHLVHPLSANRWNAQASVMLLHLGHMNKDKSWFWQKFTSKRRGIKELVSAKTRLLTLTDSK